MRKMLAGAAATTLVTGVLAGGQAYAATSPWKLAQKNDLANANGISVLSISAGGSAWAGGYQSVDGRTTPLVQHLTAKGWTTHSAPAGVSGGIRSLAVSSSTNVWAFASDRGSTRAGRWDGKKWTTTSLPGDFLPTGSAAIGPTNVWAVGGGTDDGDEVAAKYAEHWTGKAWKKTAVPAPARAVGASSAKYVWAAGTYKRQPAVMRWTGTSWKLVKTPKVELGTGAWSVLDDVLAVSSKNVWAVGGVERYCGEDHDDICAKPLIMHWNGKTWSAAVDAKESHAYTKVATDGAGGLWLLRGGWNAALVHKVGSKLTVTTTPRSAGADNDLRALASYGKTAWAAGTELSDNASKSGGIYFRSH
ncbi:hypothetical protein [Actinoallomurus rhizosphaericola]|uniref:hypothetical protein n=1 Tax=Actinoallomurus rhizosphaericola TaxID=2952536 RepID=UPI002093D479|nr:hypothetical protein [Actinoallomurus rhizosphaericola]MCO5997436.1 hypothetical protein [Actinoallomurus rhizosphaericola]